MHAFISAFLVALLLTVARAERSDYVIIGGGTAGLTIAARLSEDPNVTVTVIEAGEDRTSDVEVLAPNLLTSLYSNPKYDWNYRTIPQVNANNHVLAHPRGKQLGGSSAINFLWWTHASQQDINNWGLLGNPNWSWNALQPFYRRSESYVQPSRKTVEDLDTGYIDPALHGQDGPVLNTFADIYLPFDEAWPRTYRALGLPPSSDPRDGLALGGYTNLINMDPKTRSRSYAATTYMRGAENRPNFKVITGAHVQRITFVDSGKRPRATGALYSTNGTTHQVKARKEVILSAGAFGSPQLLELSGIGNPDILKKYGIEILVANKNVGENLQDHAYVPIGYEVKEPGLFTLDDFANETLFNEEYEKYITNHTGLLATTSAMSGLLSLAQIQQNTTDDPLDLSKSIESICPDTKKTHTQTHLRPPHPSSQHDLLCASIDTEAIVQEFAFPSGINPQLSNDSSKLFLASTPGNFFSMQGVLEHPFSRGSVHIQSSDASEYPRIDPNYLSHPLDIKVLEAIALHLQAVAQTKPLSKLLVDGGRKYQPGYYALNASNVEGWVRDNLQSEYHPCGTAAMLPKEKGGVVDEKFRVYGVDGLRVVDASVFPLIPRANLQTLVYAVAERAVEFLREG
ncbi:GMC oxidoreductase [Zasmidium cellare ATCC 36951]|uniref:GMC oxidoreductase n=1 Tax=Zasmidium cellare ATCC 36951 TaxID=1080233 RepID=A0A6A6CQS4_ZASCE|nr:GMC oxidoreductase [Zasmidium cellare ATCC 36951]KAF2168548.1 GMC oxidoreductase [Zasmidium cellare ATCC 36951]